MAQEGSGTTSRKDVISPFLPPSFLSELCRGGIWSSSRRDTCAPTQEIEMFGRAMDWRDHLGARGRPQHARYMV